LVGAAITTVPSFGFNIIKKTLPENEIIGQWNFRYKVKKDWAKMTIGHNPILNCHEM